MKKKSLIGSVTSLASMDNIIAKDNLDDSDYKKSNFLNTEQKKTYKINQVAAGHQHTFVLVNQKLFVFGRDIKGVLGVPAPSQFLQNPVRVQFPISHVQIQGVSTQKSHALAWDSNGKIYSWGESTGGKLGHQINLDTYVFDEVQDKPKLVEALMNEFIIQAACGLNLSLALNSNGEIFQWGKGIHSKQFPKEQVPSLVQAINPKKLEPKDLQGNPVKNVKFFKISCGYSH